MTGPVELKPEDVRKVDEIVAERGRAIDHWARRKEEVRDGMYERK